jgi:TonB family protein
MMFDQLIESEPEGAEFHNRRSYFMVSSLVVGILFLTAVVVSIYAADYNLGSAAFELVEIVAPPEMAAAAPEPQRQRLSSQSTSARSELPTRQENIQRPDESPSAVPTGISVAPGPKWTRPVGDFVVSDHNAPGLGGAEIGARPAAAGNGLVRDAVRPSAADSESEGPPPRIDRAATAKPAPPKSMGVVNGKASYLPKPIYSAAAIAVHAEGKVDVQVTIDETGKVISAQAVGGHPLLRPLAEQAARNARFTPTTLSLTPVKVTGVIVYNFTR